MTGSQVGLHLYDALRVLREVGVRHTELQALSLVDRLPVKVSKVGMSLDLLGSIVTSQTICRVAIEELRWNEA